MDNDQTLTVQIMHARARIAELEALLAAQSAKDSGLVPSTKRPHQIPAHFAAARETAMRLGRSISVTA
jgi:hypothetical protein